MKIVDFREKSPKIQLQQVRGAHGGGSEEGEGGGGFDDDITRDFAVANIKNTIILFVCPSKILHEHCFYFLLGPTMVPRETGDNADNANFCRD